MRSRWRRPAALSHPLTEHRKAAIHAAYARLAADPAAWAEYECELDEWDGVTGDGLPQRGVLDI